MLLLLGDKQESMIDHYLEQGELIGTATANKNGLMSKIFVVTDIERGKGLIIDYKADSNGLYTSSSLIEYMSIRELILHFIE